MLLQNPQLAYALLQAQVVMRIVDPEIALVSVAGSFMEILRYTLSREKNYLIVLLNRQLIDLSFCFLENSASPDKYPNTDVRQSSASPQCWTSLRSRCANESAESSGPWGPAYGKALLFNISFICLRMSFSF